MPMVGVGTLLGGRPGGFVALRRRRRRRAVSTRSEMVFSRPLSFARAFAWRPAAPRSWGVPRGRLKSFKGLSLALSQPFFPTISSKKTPLFVMFFHVFTLFF